jgi:hypothetical protein
MTTIYTIPTINLKFDSPLCTLIPLSFDKIKFSKHGSNLSLVRKASLTIHSVNIKNFDINIEDINEIKLFIVNKIKSEVHPLQIKKHNMIKNKHEIEMELAQSKIVHDAAAYLFRGSYDFYILFSNRYGVTLFPGHNTTIQFSGVSIAQNFEDKNTKIDIPIGVMPRLEKVYEEFKMEEGGGTRMSVILIGMLSFVWVIIIVIMLILMPYAQLNKS